MNLLPKLMSPELLAASDPMDHVEDRPLFDFGWDPDSRIYKITESLWTLGLTKHTFLFIVAGFLTVLFFWSYASKIQKGESIVPGRWGNFVESIIILLRDQITRPFMGKDGDRFLPLVATFFVYILICNLLGLLPFLDLMGKGGNTSTANYFITPGLAACAFGAYHYLGVKEEYEHHHKGVGSWGGAIWAYMKNQIPSVPIFVLPLMVLIEIAAHIIRPCALAIRLCANMVAGHVMMAVLFGFTTVFTSDFIVGGALVSLVSVTAATLLTFLELLVAVIQAFVFTFLTTVFLSMAVHPNH